jgi:hypothetical protein
VVGKGAGRHRYYCCARRRLEGKAGCGARHIPAGQADEALAGQVRALLTASGVTEQLARALAAQQAGRSAQAAARTRRRVSELQARRRRLAADYRSGALPAHLYAQELAALDSEEQGARSLLEQESAAPLPVDDLWAHLPTARRRWLLEKLAESITLERGESGGVCLAIRWRDLPGAVVSIINQLVGGGEHLS